MRPCRRMLSGQSTTGKALELVARRKGRGFCSVSCLVCQVSAHDRISRADSVWWGCTIVPERAIVGTVFSVYGPAARWSHQVKLLLLTVERRRNLVHRALHAAQVTRPVNCMQESPSIPIPGTQYVSGIDDDLVVLESGSPLGGGGLMVAGAAWVRNSGLQCHAGTL